MKAEFLTELELRRTHGTRRRQVLAPLSFRDAAGKVHTVPAGFTYNGVSFPLIWGGDGEAASALHDYAYSRPDLYTRAEADALLLQALEAEGMNALRRRSWWLGVRWLGLFFYGKSAGAVKPLDEQPIDHSPGA